MQTILTIDDDVAAKLESLGRDRNVSLDNIANEALRRGLRNMDEQSKPREPFRTKSVDCGTPLISNIDNVAEVLAIIEGDAFK